MAKTKEWSGSLCPIDPDNFWIDDKTGERVCAKTGKRALSESWAEYDSAAEYLAKRGLKGLVGDPLPENMTPEAHKLICDDPEAFQRRVKDFAYGLAMERVDKIA